MYDIDPTKNWRLVEQRLAGEQHAQRRKVLETLLAHMRAEATGDFAALMATVAPDAHYTAFGSPPESGASPRTREEVEAFYRGVVENDMHRIEHDIQRLIIDDHAAVTEGVIKIAYPGALLLQMGHEINDASAYYVYEARMCILWILDGDHLVISEDSYVDRDGFEGIAARKITLDAVRQLTNS